jgi:hypothetical protein
MRLAHGFCPASTVQAGKAHAKLLYARLQDECLGTGAKFISINLNLDSQFKASPSLVDDYKPVLPPKIQQNLKLIENHITENRHVRDMVEVLASFCHCHASGS